MINFIMLRGRLIGEAVLVAALCTTGAPARAEAGAPPCCTPSEISTLRDLVFIARQAAPPADISQRLRGLSQALAAGTYRTWSDPDPGTVLGYMAATGDGAYWRALIDSFAAEIGTTVKPIGSPSVARAAAQPPAVTGAPSAAPAPAPRGKPDPAAVGIGGAPANPTTDWANSILALRSTAGAGSSILLRSNTIHARTQADNRGIPITDSYWALVDLDGNDGGFRFLQNFNASGTTHLPWTAIGPDSRGAWSYSWYPPSDGTGGDQASGQGTGNYKVSDESSPFYHGQTLVIDGGSQAPYDYTTGAQISYKRHVLIASQRVGWPIYFAVSPQRPNGLPENKAVMKLDADGDPNPINIVIGGVLRKVVPCTINGMNVLCFK